MVNIHGLMILIFATLIVVSNSSNASTQDFAVQSPFFKDSAGNWINTKTFNSQLSAGKLTYEGQYRVQVPSTGKAVPFTFPRSADVDVNRVGSAVKKFAKIAGPIGVGIAVAELVCTNTSICKGITDIWEKELQPLNSGMTDDTPALSISGLWVSNGQQFTGTLEGAKNALGCTSATFQCVYASSIVNDTQLIVNYNLIRNSDGGNLGSKSFNYSGWNASKFPPTQTTEANDADWDTAETALNDADFVPHLVSAGQDVPVSVPDSFVPQNSVVGEKTTQLKDAGGNITGTQVETTTLTVTDNSTVDFPNQFDVKETKTIINYDINNNITDQSTTITEGPPTVPPAEENEDFEFDDMEDEELEEWEMPDVFDWESWGDGTCPANRSLDYSYGSLELSYEPACTFAEEVRPIMLIIAGIIAMYIISGIRTEQ